MTSSIPSKPQILIAEDDQAMSRALTLKLNKLGFEITPVANGEEALALLAARSFDLILLDLMMPKKDGFAVLAHLHEAHATIPVIVATNLSQEEDERRVRALGARDYIVKSNSTLDEIIKKIKTILTDAHS